MKLLPHEQFTQLPSFEGFRLLPHIRHGITEQGGRFIESSWASAHTPSEEELQTMRQAVQQLHEETPA